jgi:MFS family permease
MRERLRAGFAYVGRHSSLRGLITAQAIAFIFFAAVIPVEVVYAKETLVAGDSGYGILLASWGVGMVLGSFAFAAMRSWRLGYLLALSTVAVGIAYLGLAAAPTLLVACAASVVGGTGNGIQWVSMISAVQELTRESMQARVMSVLESSSAAMPGVGFLAGGLIASTFEPRAAFLFAGLGVLVVVVIAIPLLRRSWTREGYRVEPRTEP